MLISKLRADKRETSRGGKGGHKKEHIEIRSRLSNLEAIARQIEEDKRNQSEKLERLAGQFQIYLCYFHHMDVTLVDRCGTPTCIRRMHMVEQKKENVARKEGEERNPILLE
jgi:hypothetical protein